MLDAIYEFCSRNVDTGLGGFALYILYNFKNEVRKGFAETVKALQETNTKVEDHEKRLSKLEAKE